MNDLTLAVILITAVFAAGMFRAYIDKNISIFYLSSLAVVILSISLILNQLGIMYSWMEIILATLLAIIGSGLNLFNKLGNAKRIAD